MSSAISRRPLIAYAARQAPDQWRANSSPAASREPLRARRISFASLRDSMRTILLRGRWDFASRHNVGMAASRILGVIAVAVAAALAGDRAGGVAAGVRTARSGLYGVVTRGPVAPVCRVGVPC